MGHVQNSSHGTTWNISKKFVLIRYAPLTPQGQNGAYEHNLFMLKHLNQNQKGKQLIFFDRSGERAWNSHRLWNIQAIYVFTF